jgi:hypothetical protein
VSVEGGCGSDMELLAGPKVPRITVTKCSCNLAVPPIPVPTFPPDLLCGYICKCDNGEVSPAGMVASGLYFECKGAGTPIPPFTCPTHVETEALSFGTDDSGIGIHVHIVTSCSMFVQ